MKRSFKALSVVGSILLCMSVFAQQDSLMFPACFQHNVYNICEGYPGILGFYPIREPDSAIGILRLDIPAFLTFRRSNFAKNRTMDSFTKQNLTREGMPYTRIEIQLSEAFRRHWKQFRSSSAFPFYLKQAIVLDAEKGSAGKSGRIFWSLITDRGASAEKSLHVNVLPPLRMPETPAKRFAVGVSDIETPSGEYDDYAKQVCSFWKGLSSAEIFGNLTYGNPVPDPQFASSKESGSVCFFPNFRPDPLENDIRKGRLNHKYPTCQDHHKNYGIALAYMIDDPEGMFAKYLKDGIERFRKTAPQAKYIRWDFEPLASQYAQYDLEAFCKSYMKLEKILSYAEIERQYPRQWSNFRYEQSAQLVKKYSEAVRKYWPEVKLMLVSGYLDRTRPEANYRSVYTPLDLRTIERYVDVHSPMIYWQGPDFYDDVELNKRYLKKDFMPWIDPSEHRDVFYQRYTPSGVRQNILACAALRAKGIVFYPVGGLDGSYYQAIADAYGQIAGAEDILWDGADITKQCSVQAVNTIPMLITDVSGKENMVSMPVLQPALRWKVYRKGTQFAVALFNYNREKVILRLEIPGFAQDALVKLEPMEGEIITSLPPQETIRAELEAELKKLRTQRQLKNLKSGAANISWRALDGKAFPALIISRCSLVIDPEMAAPRAWTCPYPSWDPMINPRKVRGHLGRIFLMDKGNPQALEFTLSKFLIDGKRPSILLEHVQKPFGGFQDLENPFEGLRITSQWSLETNGRRAVLKCSATNDNKAKKEMPLILKIQSYPRIGYKFGPGYAPGILKIDGRTVRQQKDGNFLLVKTGKNPGMFHSHIPQTGWNIPGAVSISAETEQYQEELKITPDPKTAAFYNWYGPGQGLTAEFLTEEVRLKAGETVSWEFIFDYNMTKQKKQEALLH